MVETANLYTKLYYTPLSVHGLNKNVSHAPKQPVKSREIFVPRNHPEVSLLSLSLPGLINKF